MGSCESAEVLHQMAITKTINRELADEKERLDYVIKLLLLGASDSGKSTILKQMRIIHADGFSEQELKLKKKVVYENIIKNMVAILNGMEQIGITFRNFENQVYAEVLRLHASSQEHFTPEVRKALKTLWLDSGVQDAFSRRHEFNADDSLKHFLDDIDRIGSPDYVPTKLDILFTRVTTIGVVELRFRVKNMDFEIFDVGGQRSERKKWIHQFDNVNGIIFITSLSEYNQTLLEDPTTNRMKESLSLFESICNSEWFIETAMILFLNKTDVFKEKLQQWPISIAFPAYKGGDDFESSATYIKERFVSLNRNLARKIYHHRTCAVDTNQVQLVLESTLDMLIKRNTTNSGVI